MTGCADRALLGRFLAGSLSATETAAVAAHVDGCAACQEVLQQLAGKVPPLSSRILPREEEEPSEDFLDYLRVVLSSGGPPIAGTESDSGEPDPAVAAPSVPGYEVLGELSRGGMGVVYKARQVGLNRLVALKVILAGARAGEAERARFRTEGQAVARLHHPNIVHIYDVGEHGGCPYLSMELINGPTLAQACRGQPQAVRPAAALVETLARAIARAHACGIVHRDLKPANVLLQMGTGEWVLGSDGQSGPSFPSPQGLALVGAIPKIIDFGLARRLDDVTLTQSGLVLGTPNYMAPEQTRRGPVGAAADVYALGAILYELLTGRPPFLAESVESTLALVVCEEPLPPRRLHPKIPHDLETICLKCLSKEPQQRYAGAAELADDLARFLDGRPTQARPPSLLYRAAKHVRRHKTLIGGIAATVLALLAGVVAATFFALGEARERAKAEEEGRKKQREAYQARLGAAVAALTGKDSLEAQLQLQAAPAELRGWEWRHLSARLDDEKPTVLRPGKDYEAFWGFFEPGRLLAASTADHRVCLVDGRNGAVLRGLCTGDPLPGLSQTRLGPLLVREEGTLFLVGTEGVVAKVPLPPGPPPDDGTLSPDARRLALRWLGKRQPELAARALLVEVSSGRVLHRLDGGAALHHLAFSPDGSRLAAACDDGRVRLWDTARGDVPRDLQGHVGKVWGLAFHPDGQQLASGGADRTLRRWDLNSGRQLDEGRGHFDEVLSVAYSPDGRWIASGGVDRTVRVWRTEGSNGAEVLPNHAGEVRQLAFSADSNTIAAITQEREEARVWPLPAWTDLRVLPGHKKFVYAVAYSPDGRLIASAGWDHVIRLWDAVGGEPVGVLRAEGMEIPFALAFSPDSRRLVSRSEDDKLRVWDMETGESLATLPCAGMGGPERGSVHSVLVTPDGKRVAAGAGTGVRWWELATGRELEPLELKIAEVRVLAFRPDGSLLAAAGRDPDIVLVEPDTGHVRTTLHHAPEQAGPLPRSVVQALTFSPDGRRLLSAGRDRVLRLWDIETGTLVRELRGHTEEVFAAVFHPDGQRIASGGRDRAIRIWDAERGEELVRLPGHTNYLFSLAFSPGGDTLVSGSGDFTVRLWETAPLTRRLEARRALEALRPEAERLVERLLREEGTAGKVADRLRTEPGSSEPLRRAVGHALLRRGLPAH